MEGEYGVGRGRIDVCIRWPLGTGADRTWQVEGLELKVWADRRPDPLAEGALGLRDGEREERGRRVRHRRSTWVGADTLTIPGSPADGGA